MLYVMLWFTRNMIVVVLLTPTHPVYYYLCVHVILCHIVSLYYEYSTILVLAALSVSYKPLVFTIYGPFFSLSGSLFVTSLRYVRLSDNL